MKCPHTVGRGTIPNKISLECCAPWSLGFDFFSIMGEPLIPHWLLGSLTRIWFLDILNPLHVSQLHCLRSRENMRERKEKKKSPTDPTIFPLYKVNLGRIQISFSRVWGKKAGSCVALLNWIYSSQTKLLSRAKLILFCSWINKGRKKQAYTFLN